MATIDELTPEWLTSTLRESQAIGSQTVIDVSTRPVGTGQMASCHLLELTYADPSGDAPARMIAKIPSTDPGSLGMAVAYGAYTNEVRFYRDVAAESSVRAPGCYAADVSADGSDFVLLLEDLSPASECSQMDGCSTDFAGLAMRQAAALHSGSWRRSELAQREWLRRGHGLRQAAIGGWESIRAAFLERYREHLDAETATVLRAFDGELAQAWVRSIEEPTCIVHGDFRLDNLLFSAQGGRVPLAVIDWQSVSLGPGAIDVGFFLGGSLTSDIRKSDEFGLVQDYHRALIAGGVDDYGWEQCWYEYRTNAVAGFVVSVLSSMAVERTARGDRMFMAMTHRHARQVTDLESLELLKDLGNG